MIHYNLSEDYKKLSLETQYEGYLWAQKLRNGKIVIEELFNLDCTVAKDIEPLIKEEFDLSIMVRNLSYLFNVSYESGDRSVGISPGWIPALVIENGVPITRSNFSDLELKSLFLKAEKAYALNDFQTLEILEAPREYLSSKNKDLSRKRMNQIELMILDHLENLYEQDIENGTYPFM